ncbi:MAG: hypothetical protein H5T86_12130, partial [Armatimonadetes bacterium]|nr:hypothetical protein [Armatimonadota bacterium]
MNRLVVEQLCVVTLVAVLAGAGGRVRRAEPAGMEEAIVAGDWARVKQLAEQWAGEFGPDPVAQIARAAREAYEAEKRGDQAAAKRAWDAVREMAAKTPSMPDEWLIATFLRMEACWELGEVLEGSRQADAL